MNLFCFHLTAQFIIDEAIARTEARIYIGASRSAPSMTGTCRKVCTFFWRNLPFLFVCSFNLRSFQSTKPITLSSQYMHLEHYFFLFHLRPFVSPLSARPPFTKSSIRPYTPKRAFCSKSTMSAQTTLLTQSRVAPTGKAPVIINPQITLEAPPKDLVLTRQSDGDYAYQSMFPSGPSPQPSSKTDDRTAT